MVKINTTLGPIWFPWDLGCCLSFHPRLRLGRKLNNNLGPKEIIYRPRVVLYIEVSMQFSLGRKARTPKMTRLSGCFGGRRQPQTSINVNDNNIFDVNKGYALHCMKNPERYLIVLHVSCHVLLRRGHSDWSASSGQPSYYFLWPAASGRARTECDIVLISLCWKNVCT